ncbi:MAG: DUF167 domain-containing protein [Gemmatimonadota bacterium]
MNGAIAAIDGGVLIRIRVQPRASRSEFAGMHGESIKIRLTAPPVDGAANDALIEFLSEVLDVPRAAVIIRSGLTSRSKGVEVRAITPADVMARLQSARH